MSGSGPIPKPRQAGRAILRDSQGRVLLIHFVLPNMTFWATPGGGVEPGETPLAAAHRELQEELGIAVACQAERSQHKNKAKAWEMLRSRLYEEELKKREAIANATEASKSDIGWGHQIRSYVLQPYQLVKDLRTGVESTSPSSVLDGDLDDFMEASLSQRIEGGAGEAVADLD